MLRQVTLLSEALAALGTPVRTRVRVDALMLQQRRLLLEVLTANLALEQPQFALGRFGRLLLLVAHVRLRVVVGAQRPQHTARLLQIVQRAEAAGAQQRRPHGAAVDGPRRPPRVAIGAVEDGRGR